MTKKGLFLFSTIALIALAIGFFGMQPTVVAEEESNDRLVTVSGVGTMKVKPDQSIVTLAVQTNSEEADDAASENASMMEEVQAALIEAGISEDDISTKGYNLHQRYDYIEGERVSRGYQATNTIEFKTKKLDDVGKYIDVAIDTGANNVSNIKFTVEDQEDIRLELLELAVENATKKADALVNAAGATRGKVVTITENSINGSFSRSTEYDNEAPEGKGMATTPISTEDIELTANITVAFAIQ
ncbi:MAG: SIMPL domain-containing protein [Clostridia bacterium]